MKLQQRPDGWWITDMPVTEYGTAKPLDCGPYDTKDDAEDDRRGLEQFQLHWDEPGFLTSEERP